MASKVIRLMSETLAAFPCNLCLLLLAFVTGTANATPPCNHFFQKQVIAAPVVAYAAPVYYQAGVNLEIESQIRKAVREELRQALSVAPQQLRQQQTATQPSAFAKCVSCHTGPTAKGGVVLDGLASVSCHVYARWGEMAGLNENIPSAMKKLVESMGPEEKGAINTAMLRLGAARSQPADIPPPAPTRQLE